MVIFSSLKGTMQSIFQLGKNGIFFRNKDKNLRITDKEDNLVNVQVAQPKEANDAITLDYFNNNTAGGGSDVPKPHNIIIDRKEPSETLKANEKDVYFQVDDKNILQLFVYHDNKWKGMQASTTNNKPYGKKIELVDSLIQNVDGKLCYVISNNVHGLGCEYFVSIIQNAIDVTDEYSIAVTADGDLYIFFEEGKERNKAFVNIVTGDDMERYVIDKNKWVFNNQTNMYEYSIVTYSSDNVMNVYLVDEQNDKVIMKNDGIIVQITDNGIRLHSSKPLNGKLIALNYDLVNEY